MDFIDLLATRARMSTWAPDTELDAALRRFDVMLTQIADDLRVECYGPPVGIARGGAAGRGAYRLVVRAHRWHGDAPAWSLKVCSALAHAQWRADWAIDRVSRERKPLVVRALPQFLHDYAAAIAHAGKHDTGAGRRVQALLQRFS